MWTASTISERLLYKNSLHQLTPECTENYNSQNAFKQNLGNRAPPNRKGLWKAWFLQEESFLRPKGGRILETASLVAGRGIVRDQSPYPASESAEKRRIRTQRLRPCRARDNLNTVAELWLCWREAAVSEVQVTAAEGRGVGWKTEENGRFFRTWNWMSS